MTIEHYSIYFRQGLVDNHSTLYEAVIFVLELSGGHCLNADWIAANRPGPKVWFKLNINF